MNKMDVDPLEAIWKRVSSIVAAAFLGAERDEYLKSDTINDQVLK